MWVEESMAGEDSSSLVISWTSVLVWFHGICLGCERSIGLLLAHRERERERVKV